MVLPDLKAMAAQLGIKGTSGLRKGDLVSAIAAHQNSTAHKAQDRAQPEPARINRSNATASTGPKAAPPTLDVPVPERAATGHAISDPTEQPAAARTVRRRSAGRPEGAPSATTRQVPEAATRPADEGGSAGREPSATQVPPMNRSMTGHGSATAGGTNDAATIDATPPPRAQSQSAQSQSAQSESAQSESAQSESAQNGFAQNASTQNGSTQNDSTQNGSAQHDRSGAEGYEDGPRSNRRNRRNRRDRVDNRSDNGSQARSDNGSQARSDNTSPAAAAGNGDGGSRDGQNRDGQARDGQNRQNVNRPDTRQDSRPDNRTDTRQDTRQDADDDSRRGRRFRDRNRRTRDRFADAPTDTEIRDDDVLVPVAGIVDVLDSYAFIRTSGYLSGPNDVYVSLAQIRKYGLRRGDAVTGAVRAQRDTGGEAQRQKFNALMRLDSVNGLDPEQAKNRPEFTKLTPLYPNERLRLETESHILTTRIIDLVMPVGKGQRALIVSPPKAGKTSILQAIANAITTNNPEVHLMVVLVDERPEEVTDMQRSVKGEVIASTFDRPPADHTMVAELSIERAKRLVEMGRDVVVLLDSITRLGRAYNLAAPASGRILSGGVDSTALFPPKRFLGAARNIEHGGSLTIFASALVETGSAGDTVIFEEFKGTGNAELKLDRRIADKRIFPAIDVDQSSTRKEDLLLSPDELAITVKLRRVLSALDAQQALELLLDRLRKTKSNVEFLMQVAKNTPGGSND